MVNCYADATYGQFTVPIATSADIAILNTTCKFFRSLSCSGVVSNLIETVLCMLTPPHNMLASLYVALDCLGTNS